VDAEYYHGGMVACNADEKPLACNADEKPFRSDRRGIYNYAFESRQSATTEAVYLWSGDEVLP